MDDLRVLTALAWEQLLAGTDRLPLVDLAAREIEDELRARQILQCLVIKGWIELVRDANASRTGEGRVTDAGLATVLEGLASGRYRFLGR